MKKRDLIMLAGSIGGKTGSSGGSISGGTGSSGGSISGGTGSSGGNGGSQGSTDCIIADTLNAKEHLIYVQELRQWRDNVLASNRAGRLIIKTYYFISPKLVKISKRIPIIKKPVKTSAILVAKLV